MGVGEACNMHVRVPASERAPSLLAVIARRYTRCVRLPGRTRSLGAGDCSVDCRRARASARRVSTRGVCACPAARAALVQVSSPWTVAGHDRL